MHQLNNLHNLCVLLRHISIYLYIYMSICLYVYMSICLYLYIYIHSGEVRSHVEEAAGQFVRWGSETPAPAAAAAAGAGAGAAGAGGGAPPHVPPRPQQPEPRRRRAALPPVRPLLQRPHWAPRWTRGLHGAELPRRRIRLIQGLWHFTEKNKSCELIVIPVFKSTVSSTNRRTLEEREEEDCSTWTFSPHPTNQDWISTASNRSHCATTGPETASTHTAPSPTGTRRPASPWPNWVSGGGGRTEQIDR